MNDLWKQRVTAVALGVVVCAAGAFILSQWRLGDADDTGSTIQSVRRIEDTAPVDPPAAKAQPKPDREPTQSIRKDPPERRPQSDRRPGRDRHRPKRPEKLKPPLG